MTRSERIAVLTALEAFEAGDQELGVVILLDTLEQGRARVRARCPGCGAGFEWQGLCDAHIVSCWEADIAA